MYLFPGIRLVWSGISLDFSGNNLNKVPPAPYNTTVTKINLKNNVIQEIHWNAFRTYSELAYINLDQNGLRVMHDGVFDHITTLLELSLQTMTL